MLKKTYVTVAGPTSMTTINSLQNKKVKLWTSLHQKKYRNLHQVFLVEGCHLVEEAKSQGCLLECMATYPLEGATLISDEVAKKLSQTQSTSKLFGLCHLPKERPLGQRILVLDQVQDPGNVGTIIRTGVAMGFDSIVVSDDSVDVTNDKCVRSSQGAIFHASIVRKDLLEWLPRIKKLKIPVVGTSLGDKSVPLTDLTLDRLALILGNEGSGVSPDILAQCDLVTKIEMTTFESLNVAVAAGILCYHFRG